MAKVPRKTSETDLTQVMVAQILRNQMTAFAVLRGDYSPQDRKRMDQCIGKSSEILKQLEETSK